MLVLKATALKCALMTARITDKQFQRFYDKESISLQEEQETNNNKNMSNEIKDKQAMLIKRCKQRVNNDTELDKESQFANLHGVLCDKEKDKAHSCKENENIKLDVFTESC